MAWSFHLNPIIYYPTRVYPITKKKKKASGNLFPHPSHHLEGPSLTLSMCFNALICFYYFSYCLAILNRKNCLWNLAKTMAIFECFLIFYKKMF